MPQSDQTVQNATFPSVRADINDNLAALFSQSSGNSAPTTTVAFQPWVDTFSDPPVWKVRNGSNNAWITVGVLDPAGFNAGGITAIANGGTGATTAALALAALLPSQGGNAGKALVTSGSAASWGSVASGASIQVFTANGTYTPTAGKTTFLVFAIGGGGGGGSAYLDSNSGRAAGGGGGGGGTAMRLYDTTQMGATGAVTVGGGGAAASGGNSSFDPIGTGLTITGNGGSAGGTGSTTIAYGGAGGAGGTNGQLNIGGGAGGSGSAYLTSGYGGEGGTSFLAGGYGAGGQGATRSNAYGITYGDAGIAGIVFILEW
jgi:hypothetical protein